MVKGTWSLTITGETYTIGRNADAGNYGKRTEKQIDSTRLERLYLLFGDESYFVSKHAERLIAKAAGENFAAFNLQKFQGTECPADRVADAVATLPFMAEQKCVAVSDWNRRR